MSLPALALPAAGSIYIWKCSGLRRPAGLASGLGRVMAVNTTLKTALIDELHLDPRNPRLGGRFAETSYDEEAILSEMSDWNLEELATSFIENGFFVQEPLIVVKERVGRSDLLLVVEGNRRLAALKLVDRAARGQPVPKRWMELIKGVEKARLEDLRGAPYLLADSRDDVIPYIGFRHVTGIREWEPGQKAGFIAYMVDEKSMSFDEVRRTIGSKNPTVKQHYLAYKIAKQLEDEDEVDSSKVSNRFSVMYLSLRTAGVANYLGVDFREVKEKTDKPVARSKLPRLVKLAHWLFGHGSVAPVVSDSRLVDKFGEILETPEALEYLERTEDPAFDTAYRYVRGTTAGLVRVMSQACDLLEEAIGVIHFHLVDPSVKSAVQRLSLDYAQLAARFPELAKAAT